MAKTSVAGSQPGDGAAQALVSPMAAPKQENSQTTLSTLGDVSIAATDSLGRAGSALQTINWFSIVGFFFLIYFASCLASLLSFQLDRRVLTFFTPLLPVLVATAALWARQRSALRARHERCKSAKWQNALGSLSHEAASAANALRANLTGLRLAHSEASQADLLNALELATARIDKALQKANGLLVSQGKVN